MEKIRKYFVVIRLALVVFALAIAYVFTFVLQIVMISGNSMEPTYKDGQYALAVRFRAGDEVSLGYPVCCIEVPGIGIAIKRVIGYPGDTVELVDGVTYVNGKLVQARLTDSWDNLTFHVPDGAYLFLGDNRATSLDARSWTVTYLPASCIRNVLVGSGLEE